MVVAGQIVVRPMMYLALSYDHRIVDGKEAVTFLVRVKDALEGPGAAGAGFVSLDEISKTIKDWAAGKSGLQNFGFSAAV